jgi:hypothetical protein
LFDKYIKSSPATIGGAFLLPSVAFCVGGELGQPCPAGDLRIAHEGELVVRVAEKFKKTEKIEKPIDK